MTTNLSRALLAVVVLAVAPGPLGCMRDTPASATPATPPPVPFERGGKFGYVDAGGHVAIAPRFVTAQPFSDEGFAAVVEEDRRWSYIDRAGRVVVRPFVFDNGPDYFAEGLARFVGPSGKIGFVDRRMKVVIPAQFDFVEPFAQGRARFCMGCAAKSDGEHTMMVGGAWGTIDPQGEIVDPPRPE